MTPSTKTYIVLVRDDEDDGGNWWKKGQYEAVNAHDALAQAWADTFHQPRRSGSPVHRYVCAVVAPDVGWQEFHVAVTAQPSTVEIAHAS